MLSKELEAVRLEIKEEQALGADSSFILSLMMMERKLMLKQLNQLNRNDMKCPDCTYFTDRGGKRKVKYVCNSCQMVSLMKELIRVIKNKN